MGNWGMARPEVVLGLSVGQHALHCAVGLPMATVPPHLLQIIHRVATQLWEFRLQQRPALARHATQHPFRPSKEASRCRQAGRRLRQAERNHAHFGRPTSPVVTKCSLSSARIVTQSLPGPSGVHEPPFAARAAFAEVRACQTKHARNQSRPANAARAADQPQHAPRCPCEAHGSATAALPQCCVESPAASSVPGGSAAALLPPGQQETERLAAGGR